MFEPRTPIEPEEPPLVRWLERLPSVWRPIVVYGAVLAFLLGLVFLISLADDPTAGMVGGG